MNPRELFLVEGDGSLTCKACKMTVVNTMHDVNGKDQLLHLHAMFHLLEKMRFYLEPIQAILEQSVKT